jgi:hypothetical protein
MWFLAAFRNLFVTILPALKILETNRNLKHWRLSEQLAKLASVFKAPVLEQIIK